MEAVLCALMVSFDAEGVGEITPTLVVLQHCQWAR